MIKDKPMIIYNVTTKVNHEIHSDWLQWMKAKHIPDVLATGNFLEAKISRLLGQDESDGITYATQYLAIDQTALHNYQTNNAMELQKDHQIKYGDKYVCFRTILQVEEDFKVPVIPSLE